jgi:group I intron endonuclease
MESIIYKIENPLGEIYIGSTKNRLGARIAEHKYNIKRNRKGLLYESFNKYGFENHTFEKIFQVSKENVLQFEHFIINSLNPQLNLVKSYNATATNKIWVNDGMKEFQVYQKDSAIYNIGRLYKKIK